MPLSSHLRQVELTLPCKHCGRSIIQKGSWFVVVHRFNARAAHAFPFRAARAPQLDEIAKAQRARHRPKAIMARASRLILVPYRPLRF